MNKLERRPFASLRSPFLLGQNKRIYIPQSRTKETHCHPLVKFIFDQCERQRISPKELAKKAGLGDRCAIYKWRKKWNPQLPNFEAVINALGFEIKIVRKKGD